MDRKMSSTSSKLRNLKEFLSSTRSLSSPQSQLQINQNGGVSTPTAGNTSGTTTTSDQIDNNTKFQSHYHKNKSGGSSSINKKNPKNSISLFNLMSVTRESSNKRSSAALTEKKSRPVSDVFDDLEPYGYHPSPPHKSISMFGLGPSQHRHNDSPPDADDHSSYNNQHGSTRNLAARLFYNIRSRFRKRRRDRNNKIVDSKSTDFGSFLGADRLKSKTPHYSEGGDDDTDSNDRTTSSATRHPHPMKSSRSVDNVLESLFGSRRLRSVTSTDFSNEDPQSPSRLQITHPHLENNQYHRHLSDSFAMEPSSSSADDRDNIYEESDNVFDDSESSCNRIQSPNTINNSLNAIVPVAVAPTPLPSKPLKCLTKELEDLLYYGWYWAGLSKEEAEAKLKGQPDGAFVVRDSSSDHYLLSLSFNSNGRSLHTRIEYRNGQFSFYSSDADSFPTVAELIEHCIAFSELGVFCYSRARRSDYPSYPVRLTKPISRFTEVKSLLYLSRFVIRQYVRLDLIPQLPLPQSLIEFVAEQRYI